ncbi:UNKNOWN [Stylonychia lemnae]|uniref:Queuosine 5'-phosphate N-glycosylase/hydrolase n=1 Tax=Stylonychia lemnae TaxID=5949 RepID=A0A078AT08_STYLE|nr:UNKNOWN [Stylonychia lemnae]|eukprot:CDW83988.1 UNKNOWN [Stylonychia lemnae]
MKSLIKSIPDIINPCAQVRRTCQRVSTLMENQVSPSVIINSQKLDEFIQNLELKVKQDNIAYEQWAKYHMDPNNYSIEQVLAYIFVVDGMNFCFWPNNPSGNFEYEHMTKNLAKILDEQPDFFIPKQLTLVQADELKSRVFNNMEFALLEERARIVREIGYIVETSFDGSFVKFLERSDFDVPTLIKDIVQNFSGFRDEAIYQGEQVCFYKRAQILVADIIGALQEKKNMEQFVFENQEQLTMFADYRVPQILRHVGIFQYSEELANKIDNEIELPYSSTDEVEIRAQTVVAVEMILGKVKENQVLNQKIKYSFEIDWLLWQMGENNLDSMKPHHKVLSIFY